MQEIAALVVFSFVNAATPGPNNVLLWASGAQFGFRRTLPHVAGRVVGIGALALAVAAGIGAIVTSVPAVAVLMKVAGSGYLLYLAWQIALSGALERADVPLHHRFPVFELGGGATPGHIRGATTRSGDDRSR